MMRFLLLVVCQLACSATVYAEAPYKSAGFLAFPSEVELGAVSAVAVDAKDNIYVLHRGEPAVIAFSPEGKYLRSWGQGMFKVPHGLRIDGEGNVWTTDNGNHVLRKFSPEGRLLLTLGQEGKPAAGETGFRAPDDIVFDSKGNMYVADSGNGRIVKLDASGKFVLQWGKKGKAAGEFATAHSLAIDGKDRVYVGDRGNKRVQVFDSAGKHFATWDSFGGNPFGMIVVKDQLLLTEGDIHRIYHLDADGKVVAQWGDPQLLQLPHLMAVNSRGRLYVAEVNGKRVQMFDRD